MAFFILCSFLVIFLSYKNPVEADHSLPVLDAVKNLKVIFQNPKFFYVLIIFSGCWFMLYTRKPFTPIFMTDFNILPAWFIPVLAALNPGTIITLGQVWAYLIKDRDIDSLKMLIAGVLIISAGFFIVGLTLNPVIFFAGIIMLSFGEMVSYPAYLSYVSKIPPKDQRSIYMGYSFMPLAIAGVTAPIVDGFLYYFIAENMAMGRLFWAIIASIGLVAASAFIHYDFHYNKTKKELKKRWSANIPLLFIPVILLIAFSMGPDPIYRGILSEEDETEEVIDEKKWMYTNKTYVFDGRLDEAESVSYDFSSENAFIDQIALSLSWSDEKDKRRLRRFENKGDMFSAKIFADDTLVGKDSFANEHDQQGFINLIYEDNTDNDELISQTRVEIELVQCKDYYPAVGLDLISIEDDSNMFDLKILVTFKEYT